MNQLESKESQNRASSLAEEIKLSIVGRNTQLSRLVTEHEPRITTTPSSSLSLSSPLPATSISSGRPLDRCVISEDARRLGFSSDCFNGGSSDSSNVRDKERLDYVEHLVNDINYQNPYALTLMRECFGIDASSSYVSPAYESTDSWDYKTLSGDTYYRNPRFQKSLDDKDSLDGQVEQIPDAGVRLGERGRNPQALSTAISSTEGNFDSSSLDDYNRYVFSTEGIKKISGNHNELDIRESIMRNGERSALTKNKSKKSSKKSSSKNSRKESKKTKKHKEKEKRKMKKKEKSKKHDKKKRRRGESNSGYSSNSSSSSNSSNGDNIGV